MILHTFVIVPHVWWLARIAIGRLNELRLLQSRDVADHAHDLEKSQHYSLEPGQAL